MVASAPFLHPSYNVIRELARGTYTAVYEATLTRPQLARRSVALMVLCDRKFDTRFLRIAQVTASLDHPGIVPCYEDGMASDLAYISLALVRGGDLMHRISLSGPATLEDTVRIICEVAALDYAHGRGVVHGHLHPKHVLLDESGRPRLTGFEDTRSPRK